jgi:excisionase family DNA binding protein
MAIEFPEIMAITETCNNLCITRLSLHKLAQEGKIPYQKVGKNWRFRKEAIDRWLEVTLIKDSVSNENYIMKEF